ncbi:MAG: QueT transporter family protein [Lachnospiraceae bacterium]|nr:QueT transporter family protein [Lachnospiraceae bacterium]
MDRRSTLFLTRAALIAALYVVLSEVSQLLGLCSGVIQCRISEALTILPAFLVEAIPGLYIGCLLTNILTGCAAWDIAFGPVATLLGALVTYAIGRAVRARAYHKPTDADGNVSMKASFGRFILITIMYVIPPILANAMIIPPILRYAYGAEDAYWFLTCTVAAGEIIACGIFGGLLHAAIVKNAGLRNLILTPTEKRPA